MGNRVTVIAIPRESPATGALNDGSIQRLVIELSCSRALLLACSRKTLICQTASSIFDAASDSHHKFEKSAVIARVAGELKNVPEADCCIILVFDIAHIGVDLNKIIFVKSILQGMHSNAK